MIMQCGCCAGTCEQCRPELDPGDNDWKLSANTYHDDDDDDNNYQHWGTWGAPSDPGAASGQGDPSDPGAPPTEPAPTPVVKNKETCAHPAVAAKKPKARGSVARVKVLASDHDDKTAAVQMAITSSRWSDSASGHDDKTAASGHGDSTSGHGDKEGEPDDANKAPITKEDGEVSEYDHKQANKLTDWAAESMSDEEQPKGAEELARKELRTEEEAAATDCLAIFGDVLGAIEMSLSPAEEVDDVRDHDSSASGHGETSVVVPPPSVAAVLSRHAGFAEVAQQLDSATEVAQQLFAGMLVAAREPGQRPIRFVTATQPADEPAVAEASGQDADTEI